MRLIDADALYEQIKEEEEMARNRVLNTESSLPYPTNLNPSYTRYLAQMNERTRLKHMVADATTIEERKTGKWLMDGKKCGELMWRCSECKVSEAVPTATSFVSGIAYPQWKFCPNCGAKMEDTECN